MAGDDENAELVDAPTVGAAVRILGARAIEERFGIPPDAARVLAEAVVPAGDLGIEYARVGSTGLVIRPVSLGALTGGSTLAIRDADIAAQVPEEETLAGILDLAALWVDAQPGRSLRVEVRPDAVRVELVGPDEVRSVELPRTQPEMPSAVVHDGVATLVAGLDDRAVSPCED